MFNASEDMHYTEYEQAAASELQDALSKWPKESQVLMNTRNNSFALRVCKGTTNENSVITHKLSTAETNTV